MSMNRVYTTKKYGKYGHMLSVYSCNAKECLNLVFCSFAKRILKSYVKSTHPDIPHYLLNSTTRFELVIFYLIR